MTDNELGTSGTDTPRTLSRIDAAMVASPRPQKPPPLQPQMIPEGGKGFLSRMFEIIRKVKVLKVSLLTIERQRMIERPASPVPQAPSEQVLAETDLLMTRPRRINDNTILGWPPDGYTPNPEPKITPNPEAGERKLIL